MKLEEVVPWGRSLAEYRSMFSLSDPDLNIKILGCGDSPASFNAEMTKLGRYLYQSLPKLKFVDDRFELCVCSHLLFLYSEQLSLDFHLASIHELLRVATEVRIFPLLGLDGEPSSYLELVLKHLSTKGFNIQVESVDYEFQKGGNQMLRIIR